MKIYHIKLITILLFASENIFAAENGNKKHKLTKKIFSPDYVNLQYTGNLGLGSVGLGYVSVKNKNRLE